MFFIFLLTSLGVNKLNFISNKHFFDAFLNFTPASCSSVTLGVIRVSSFVFLGLSDSEGMRQLLKKSTFDVLLW
ncbi:hypothetical protein ACOSQ2_017553 [Xanthoceras sorbifolium]